MYERALEPKELVYIEGAGHIPTQEQAKETLTHISGWLKTCLLEGTPTPQP
jgi:pimeloyl-ACP methyl ester carboxylesterase